MPFRFFFSFRLFIYFLARRRTPTYPRHASISSRLPKSVFSFNTFTRSSGRSVNRRSSAPVRVFLALLFILLSKRGYPACLRERSSAFRKRGEKSFFSEQRLVHWNAFQISPSLFPFFCTRTHAQTCNICMYLITFEQRLSSLFTRKLLRVQKEGS